MSFNVTLMINYSEDNKARKALSTVSTLTGTLREESSIIDPVITIDTTGLNIDMSAVNYCYIATFGRYYFIRNIESIRNNIWRLTMHSDVLQSFYSEYADCYGIPQRQANNWNLYVNDGVLKVRQDKIVDTVAFPNGFNTQTPCYLLITI